MILIIHYNIMHFSYMFDQRSNAINLDADLAII